VLPKTGPLQAVSAELSSIAEDATCQRMTEPTTDKEWADYLCDVLRRLDTLPVKNRGKNAALLQQCVNEACDALAFLLGDFAAAEIHNEPDTVPVTDDMIDERQTPSAR
jgi:hypothetical protein